MLARAVALAAVYAGVYELITVETSFGTSVGATLWPASGVTVSMLLLCPRREWPVYLMAIWVADFSMDIVSAGFTTRIAYGLATANCLEPLLSATLLRRWLPGRPDLSRLRELGLFYGAAAVCGPMLSATVGSLWYSALGGGAIWPFAGRWYVGDALGVIVVAPLLLVIAGTSYRPSLNFARKCAYALTFAMIALALPWGFTASLGLPFLVIPALSVTGLLLGTRAAALAVFVAGAVVETLTTIGEGPFSGVGPFTGLLPAQMFLVACSASGLTAAALMAGLASREKMALHDSLTGLANRRLLLDRVSVACAHLARRPGAVGLMFVDLDGFKTVNDAYGHAVGDHVLVETARRLQSVVRGEDTIARIGGDEFVILLDRVDDQSSLPALSARVEHVLAEPITAGAATLRMRASVGYAVTERHDESHESLLMRADHAMYAAKHERGV
ncbi:MAG TPA: diguanylate cyclase [Gaiellaceae bacterium]|nr:diguanylate cyclase [Gaiellaceae bacterium]